MSDKIKNYAAIIFSALCLLTLSLWCWLKPEDEISMTERRTLVKMPELTVENVLSTDFMTEFESYSTDQFPLRDRFRRLKGVTSFYIFRQKDVNGVFVSDGYAAALEYPIDRHSLDRAAEKFGNICEKYLDENNKVYFSIIPDKCFYMARDGKIPSLDYAEFTGYLEEKLNYMTYIDIFDTLSLDSYYKTDTHWRQEKIRETAGLIAGYMDASLDEQYDTLTLDEPFYGVYCGQASIPFEAETINYVTSPSIESCTVYDYETDREIKVYDMEKAGGRDPYEMFLSGSKSLLKITNPNADRNKRLIIFRDSFGSSIAPLFIEAYSELILVDIRYISSELLGRFVDFTGADVLFLYSTLVLNNSETLK